MHSIRKTGGYRLETGTVREAEMKIYASGEDYLEAVLVLQKKKVMVRSVDLARHMGFSKPSISHAVGVLKNGGFLTVDEDGYLHLTEDEREVAEKIYEKYIESQG